MTEIDYAWAAGIFEGEGCLSWTRKGGERPYPCASVSMTDEDVVRRFAAIIGVGKITQPRKRENRKQQWQWRGFGAATMARLHETIGPHLGQRRRAKLDEMLTFEPRRETERGRWIGTRWFSDPARITMTDSEIRSLLLLGRSYSQIRGVSAKRIAKVRNGIDPRLLERAARMGIVLPTA